MTESSIPYDTMSTTSTSSDSIFKKCCFCVPLRVGCFILGYLNLVANFFHIFHLITLTTLFGIFTHGFDHLDSIQIQVYNGSMSAPMEKEQLKKVGFLLIAVVVANTIWMLVNIACLVGLHKRKPGPIRVYVGVASAHLFLSMAGFVYFLVNGNKTADFLVVLFFDLGLTAYFILVYYIYAGELEKEMIRNTSNPHSNPEFIIIGSAAYVNSIVQEKEKAKPIM